MNFIPVLGHYMTPWCGEVLIKKILGEYLTNLTTYWRNESNLVIPIS